MRQKLCGVYLIICDTNSKVYVGSSVDIANRWWNHKSQLKWNKHDNRHLQSAWNKYGADAFRLKIIKLCDRSQLVTYEQIFIEKFQSFTQGFNLSPDASHPVHSDKTRQQIRERMIQQWQDPDYRETALEKLVKTNTARRKPRRSPEAHREQALAAARKGTEAYLRHRQEDPEWAKHVDEKRARALRGIKQSLTPQERERRSQNGKAHQDNLTGRRRK